jgi:hypothetical protein
MIVLAATSATCFAQSPATFHTQTYTERASNSVYAVDLNNDGTPDLVQQTMSQNSSSNTFTVRIANGNGTFRDPVVYSFSSFPPNTLVPMATGDFNGDGNVDLIFDSIEPSGGVIDQLVLFLGKGDGTFQAPKYITVALPSGDEFSGPIIAGDFNGDGKLDLVAVGNPTTITANSGNWLFLILGDGTGNFGTPSIIYMPPVNNFVGGDTGNLVAGDFDGDGRADVAFLDTYDCTEGGCAGTLHVLYNNGNSRFTDTATSASSPEDQTLDCSTGDLNSDGQTDIFCVLNNAQLDVLYGQTDRTFHIYMNAIPAIAGQLAMADFNGDTRMDLVGLALASSGTSNQLLFFLADSSEGMFTQETYSVPGDALNYAVGDFNSDTRPDVLVLAAASSNATNTTIDEVLNTTANGSWGGCAYPKAGMGISVCAPGASTASPVTFNASANSFGQLRLMELWVDGKKLADQYHAWGSRAWFDLTGTTLTSGAHRGVMFAKDIDNREQETVFNFTVGGAACTAPSTAGVQICTPASGSTVSSPVQVKATAKVNGTIAHTQLWVDGVNKFTSASTTLTTSISLAAGTHRFAVVATNTAGQKWESALNATVK